MELILSKKNSLIMDIPVNPGNKCYYILKIFGSEPPFSHLGDREKQILSLIWTEYLNRSSLSKEEVYDYIFKSSEFKEKACKKLNIEKTNYYNLIKKLRRKNFIGKRNITHEAFVDRLSKNNIVFRFIEK